jgi:hypothetical protein
VHVLAGVHAAQVVVLDHAHAAAFHLLEEAAALKEGLKNSATFSENGSSVQG